jgi:hypothetical protein
MTVCFDVKEILLAVPIDRWVSYEERSIAGCRSKSATFMDGPWFIVTREVKNEFLENKKLIFVAVGLILV